MEGWMDGWMDGWMEGWMEGWMDELMDGKTHDQDRKVILQAPNQLPGRVTWIMEPEGRSAEMCFLPRNHNLPSVSSAIMLRLLIQVTFFFNS